ncbi:hypothetical protein SDC9_183884 [bioreactor metagenome]|uniref:Uncharacterized protein n=1 Tax=bioreactor metagenome TaxID=1076179 RepID=A0A645HBH2_9ZZZZ
MVCALKEIKIENKRIKMKKIDFEKVEIPFFLKLHISTLLKKLKILGADVDKLVIFDTISSKS